MKTKIFNTLKFYQEKIQNLEMRKFFLIGFFIVIAVVDIMFYWNSHVYFRAKRINNSAEKIKVLNKSAHFFPSNDLVYYDLGKAYFDSAISELGDTGLNNSYLQKSVDSFKRSININPFFQFSHFYLAQSLQYQSFTSPSSDSDFYDQFKKSAILAGNNSEIFFEVGKRFLSNWPQISEEDKEFTIEILKKALSRGNQSELHEVLNILELNVKNYDIMEKFLPENAQSYRIYAKFLGERALSLQERHRVLSYAEFLEFERAKYQLSLGENRLFYSQVNKALERFKICIKILENIKFYQNLNQDHLIDLTEFKRLQKKAFLNVGKCIIWSDGSLTEAIDPLRKYLNLEENISAINDLESYLVYQGLIDEKLNTSFEDLLEISLQLQIYFKQNRYAEIIRLGNLINQSLIVLGPQMKKEEYIKILLIVGDAHQKVNQLYDADSFYLMAKQMVQDEIEPLVKIRRNYERLNENEKVQEISEIINDLKSPEEIDFESESKIGKDEEFLYRLLLDDQRVILDLFFLKDWEGISPLITVFFNGQVIWEDLMEDEVLSLPVSSQLGENILQIIAVNKPIGIAKLHIRPQIQQ